MSVVDWRAKALAIFFYIFLMDGQGFTSLTNMIWLQMVVQTVRRQKLVLDLMHACVCLQKSRTFWQQLYYCINKMNFLLQC